MGSEIVSMIDGMSQNERLIPALLPDYVHPDERDIPDLIKYIADLSEHFAYYDYNNVRNGNWESFFKSDVHILIALITKFDTSGYIKAFFTLEQQLHEAMSKDEITGVLSEIFRFVFGLIQRVQRIHSNLQAIQRAGALPLKTENLDYDFSDEISTLYTYNLQAYGIFDEWMLKENVFEALGAGIKKDADDVFKGKTIKSKSINAFAEIREIFNKVRSRFNALYNACKAYQETSPITAQKFPPHLAMFITFLELFSSLKKPMNQLTAKHLHFYYNDILGLTPAAAVADKVHVLFDAVPNINGTMLLAGTELTGEMPGTKEPVSFSLDKDLYVNHARIRELKTLYVAREVQVSMHNDVQTRIQEVEMYRSINTGQTGWPIMGEEQISLPDDERSMEEAQIGLLIASPILYQPHGLREITVTFHLESESFKDLLEHITQYSGFAGNVNKQSTAGKLLSDSFLIHFTAPDGWEEADRLNVHVDKKERLIALTIYLAPYDEKISVYDVAMHGNEYDPGLPAVRLMVNNFAGHNPLTFLQGKSVLRIGIRANVQGNNALSLRNGNGPLSMANPFQPFGPLAPVGSYLEMRNTNIMNRYTKNLCIHMDWEGLPDLPGGWKTYYKAYKNGVDNGSFIVKIGTLKEKDDKGDGRHEYRLFNTSNGNDEEGALRDETVIEGLDVKSLDFTNMPLMDKDSLPWESNNPDGILRMELISPSDGFGNRIFTTVFPETALHNSKWYNKKAELPNPPYIPVIRNIAVDYCVELTEDMNTSSGITGEQPDLKLIHIHPFGYENVYPSNKSEHTILPHFENGQNLFIGFSDLKKYQELSIFFQIEETDFTGTSDSPIPVIWSSLSNNAWHQLDERCILSDSTKNFIQSGIVKLQIPEEISAGNTILEPSLLWLKASRPYGEKQSPKVTGIYLHAGSATRMLAAGKSNSTVELPPFVLKGFRTPLKEIQSVKQPFPSFGGKAPENLRKYYTRVNERLRHKQRLLTPIDIEQAVLQNFPDILMAKCLRFNPDRNEIDKNAGMADVRVVLISCKPGKVLVSEQPKVSRAVLCEIKDFLTASVSPFLKVSVENPTYEKIKVVCKVRFKKDQAADPGLYLKRFEEDIKRYLCPWLFDAAYEFRIGGKLSITDMLNYIKKKDYISHVTSFSLVHFYKYPDPQSGELLNGMIDYAGSKKDFVNGFINEAVLVPALRHFIELIPDPPGKAELKPNLPAMHVGIGQLAIGEELLVYREPLDDQENDSAERPGRKFNWTITQK